MTKYTKYNFVECTHTLEHIRDFQPSPSLPGLTLPLWFLLRVQERMKIGGLCPLFSLLATCLRSPRCSEDLDTIEATLGAAIILADSVTVGGLVAGSCVLAYTCIDFPRADSYFRS